MKQTRIKLDAADTLLFEQILVDAFVKNDARLTILWMKFLKQRCHLILIP